MARKVYVGVRLTVGIEGNATPKQILWEDGRTFEIDDVTDIRRAASHLADGTGIRYTCTVKGKKAYLFYENPRWFVEGK